MKLRIGIAILLSAIITGACGAADDIVWLETERFNDCGGWISDTQFIDQMGSPYLLAAGIGSPVRDAATSLTLPRAGRYRLWARVRDWNPQFHPGRFNFIINNKTAGPVFGANGKTGWHWEDGGLQELPQKIEIRLHDLTGFYGRCDAIALAADAGWTPPDDKNSIAALREQYGGVSRQIKDMGEHDVVVIGGGLAGCTAAVAAARLGARVALIQDRPILGGNASTEILVPPVGVWPHAKNDPLDPRETGLVEEYRTAGNQKVIEGMLYSERLMRFVKLEPNLDLFLNTHATGAEMQADSKSRIAAALAQDAKTGQRMRFVGRIFIDCSGESAVAVSAGAEYRQGKEPKSMYNEPWAPENPSTNTMGNGLKYYHEDAGKPQPFVAPAWAFHFPACDSFGAGRHPRFITNEEIGYQWQIELGGLQDTYADAEEIRDDLFRLIYGLWDHTKNHCDKDKQKADTQKLVWVSYVAGKRENRRLIGDYVLTQNDLGGKTPFPDGVAYGGWAVDDHYSGGFFQSGSPSKNMDTKQYSYHGVHFTIPFRCLYSKNIENLMMAGRNISASHLGMSDTRVMLTCAVMGHAAGAGAALCIEHSAGPRDICDRYMEQLQQQLLKDGAYIIGLPNRDPRDLARKAAVKASSEAAAEIEPYKGEKMAAANVINGYARAEGGKTNAWAPDKNAKPPHWIELSWSEPQTFNMVHVAFQTVAFAAKRLVIEAWQNGAWKQAAEVTENRHRRVAYGMDRVTAERLRIVFDEPCGICEIRVYDEPDKAVVAGARRAESNLRLPDQGPWLPWDRGQLPKIPPTYPGAFTLPAKPSPATISGITFSEAAKKYGGVLIEASQAEMSGEWTPSTYLGPFIGANYVNDGNSEKGQKKICFKPNLPKAGVYTVRLAYTALKNRATNTPVTIKTSRGSKTVLVNQRLAPEVDGLFHSLGKFDLDAGEATSIVISNEGTDGYVVVDAMNLLPEAAR
ncbi:MAG: FAD-dependent oxidoreductase [Candidatus Sumerlaeota bacterium]|nr:FAD-dependent oxidoreductase [Candidatus Sumerlaeota bacterium]